MEGAKRGTETYSTTSLAKAAFVLASGGPRPKGINRDEAGRVRFDFEAGAESYADMYEAGYPVVAKDYYHHLTQLRAVIRDI